MEQLSGKDSWSPRGAQKVVLSEERPFRTRKIKGRCRASAAEEVGLKESGLALPAGRSRASGHTAAFAASKRRRLTLDLEVVCEIEAEPGGRLNDYPPSSRLLGRCAPGTRAAVGQS